MTVRYAKVSYKYRLFGDAEAYLGFAPPNDIITEYVEFYTTGLMRLKDGYCSDGCSGPTIDDGTNMQGGFFHDGGYQLMRLGLLDRETYKPLFDWMLQQICLVDGMNRLRAEIYYDGVAICGDQYAKPQRERIYTCGKPIHLERKA